MPKWFDVDEPCEDERLVTVEEFARATRMAEVTVRQLIKAGTIPAVRLVFGRIRIRQSTLDSYLTPRRQGEGKNYKPRKFPKK